MCLLKSAKYTLRTNSLIFSYVSFLFKISEIVNLIMKIFLCNHYWCCFCIQMCNVNKWKCLESTVVLHFFWVIVVMVFVLCVEDDTVDGTFLFIFHLICRVPRRLCSTSVVSTIEKYSSNLFLVALKYLYYNFYYKVNTFYKKKISKNIYCNNEGK